MTWLWRLAVIWLLILNSYPDRLRESVVPQLLVLAGSMIGAWAAVRNK